jgi:predicted outer membrane protein
MKAMMSVFSRGTGRARVGRRSPLARLALVLAVIGTVGSCGVSATGSWHDSDLPGHDARKDTTLDAPHGPLYPADVKMLVAVAQAGLWEAPASEDVARRSTNPKVRAVAAQLAEEHHVLHKDNIAAADRLQVQLPQAPTSQQQGWRDEIGAASGDELDRVYVNLTRAAHGSVYMAIATVRSTTQNDVIRSSSAIAEEYVSRHMALLESTGLATSDALAVHSGTSAEYQALPAPVDFALGIALLVAVGLGTLLVVRFGSRVRPEEAAEEEEAQAWT